MTGSGAVILGGAHGALALARSFGARGVAVCCIGDDSRLPGWSKYVRQCIRWAGPYAANAAELLLEIGRKHKLQGWLLVPAGDAEVRLVSEHHTALSTLFRLALPPWEALQWACDKPLLYRRAAELGIDVPRTYRITSTDELSLRELVYPIVLKPHMGGGRDAFTKAKVIRADGEAAFVRAFCLAAAEISANHIVVQELVPGGGESQFSYAALWDAGRPVAEFTVRRMRQYPPDFGYTSTFVETVDEPQAKIAARRLLASIEHSGLVEIEFKYDRRDGRLKLLDVNPRPWSWFGLSAAAGVDLGALLWTLVEGGEPLSPEPRQGVAWIYLSRDIASAARSIARGDLRLRDYPKALAGVRAFAAFSADDPMPGVVDLPLTAWRVMTRRLGRTARYRMRTGASVK